jgi:long-chain acyl-CoA synthetase
MSTNLYELFHQTALRQPESPAVLGPRTNAVLSYRELDAAIGRAAERLRAAGLRAGDQVGLHLPSSADYIIWTYAVWQCDACVAPVPMELAAPEKREILECLSLDYFVSRESSASFLDPFRRPASGVADEMIVPIQCPRERPPGLGAIHAAFIRYTSGTTGAAKGIVLSHETIQERIHAANEPLQIGPSDRVLWVLSMSYHFTATIVGYLTFGATVVLPANHFAGAIIDAIQHSQATVIYASPMQYSLLADFPQAKELTSLRLAISTTAALEAKVARRFQGRYGLPVSQALGIIEVGLPCIHVDAAEGRADSVGRLSPAFGVRLEDAGLGPELQEISLRGPGLLDAYYHPWRTRQEIMPDGWFRTGDLGCIDEDGYLFLRGRSKDVLNVMGMKFFPYEIERVLATHPQVAAACAFLGRDERRGDIVCARVVTHQATYDPELEQDLRRLCRDRLATYKVPDRFEFVRALPRTASGKVLRRAVEQAAT